MNNPETFNQRLRAVQHETNSLLCVGIDPDIDRLPAHLSKDVQGVREFCYNIIQSTSAYVCGYKFNSAFFEVLGPEGFELLGELRGEIPKPLLAIYDVKRGDIGNTAKQYARAAFETLKMDAVTINPYMGFDAVKPFIENPKNGAFVLCLTSNEGSGDFQQQTLDDGSPLFIQVANKCTEWNSSDNIGLVVGATKPEYLTKIRSATNDLPILAPGVGAQGGDLEQTLAAGLLSDSTGMIIPISRSIIFASDELDYAEKAAEQAKYFQEQINTYRQKV